MKFLSKISRLVLISEQTSRCNKLHLIAGWVDEGYYLEYKWKALPMLSRLMIKFEPDGDWITTKSFEEDILTKYKVT